MPFRHDNDADDDDGFDRPRPWSPDDSDPGDDWSDDEDGAEDDDDSDENAVVPCPKCGCDVYEDAEQCPLCGEWLLPDSSPFSGRSEWFAFVGIAGIVAVIAVLSGVLSGC